MKTVTIFDDTIATLNRALDLRSVKNRLLSSDIANIDTPNYKAFDLLVKENMAEKTGRHKALGLRITRQGHIASARDANNMNIRLTRLFSPTLPGDRNTVDIGRMMASLAKNTIMYDATARLISKKFQDLRYVISEGK